MEATLAQSMARSRRSRSLTRPAASRNGVEGDGDVVPSDLNLNREIFEEGLPRSLAYYTAACQRYGVETDAGVLSALRFGKSKLRTSADFRDKGMLPLVGTWLCA